MRLLEVVVAVRVCRLDAAHRSNDVNRPGGHAQRVAAQGVAILAFHGHGGARESAGHGLVDRGEDGFSVGAFRELDDDDDGAIGVLAGLRARAAARG